MTDTTEEAVKVTVVNHGVGNVGSVLNMLERLGMETRAASRPDDILSPHTVRLLLPGVGAFDAGMNGMAKRGLDRAVIEAANQGIPILGICLGMQMLLESSEEGKMPGLGLLPGTSRRLIPDDPRLRVPHMGWNWVTPVREGSHVDNSHEKQRFYFAHSYAADCPSENILATTRYGLDFPSVIGRGSVVGAQFHPEKSHHFGMRFLESVVGTSR